MPSFTPHPLAVAALAAGLPAGPVADLACGPSGSALLAAAAGRQVTAVDVADVALDLLDREAQHRGLGGLITLVHADLSTWRPPPDGFALVLATGFWDRAAFATAAGAVRPGGLLGWEAFTIAARRARPSLRPPGACAPVSQPPCCLRGSRSSASRRCRAAGEHAAVYSPGGWNPRTDHGRRLDVSLYETQ